MFYNVFMILSLKSAKFIIRNYLKKSYTFLNLIFFKYYAEFILNYLRLKQLMNIMIYYYPAI